MFMTNKLMSSGETPSNTGQIPKECPFQNFHHISASILQYIDLPEVIL